MPSQLEQTHKQRARAFLAAALALFLAAFSQSAAAEDSQDAQWTWSAELVSFDEAERTLTVKSLLENRADREILGDLMEGDRVTLTWTGISWGAAVAGIHRGEESAPSGRLVLPAQFVGTEMDQQYLVYRVPVPEASVSRIEGLEPGSWVTATSPRDPAGFSEAVIEVRPYNDVS